MCRIEDYDVVYPDGFIDRKRRVVPCKRGTRSSPCQNLEYDNDSYEERPATEEEIRATMEPSYHVIAPRPESSSRSEPTSEGSKPKGMLKKLFGFKDKPKYVLVRKRAGEYRLTNPRSQTRTSGHESSPPKEPLKKQRSNKFSKSATNPQNPRRRPHEVEVHNPSKEKGQSSSSPKSESKPRQRPLSPIRDPEPNRAQLRDEERRRQRVKQEHKDKAAKEQEEAQARAEKLHEEEEEDQRQQKLAWARGEGKRRRNGRPASYHAIPDVELTDEQLRAQQRQYERDSERLQAFDRFVAQQQEEEDRRTRQETEDRHARRRVDDQERLAWRRQEDGNRRRRQREAGVPRSPRHSSIIHDSRNSDPEDFDQRGSDFIESAIREAEWREPVRRAPPVSWDLPVRGRDGLVRRNTIDGSQREERNGRRKKGYKRHRRSD